jgi:hypothetical protein
MGNAGWPDRLASAMDSLILIPLIRRVAMNPEFPIHGNRPLHWLFGCWFFPVCMLAGRPTVNTKA